jgi:uncharacterized membrane protein YesL
MRRRWRREPDGTIVRVDVEEAGESAEPARPAPGTARRAKLGLALRLGFRDTYDYLGVVLLVSLLWTAAASLSLTGGLAVGSLLFAPLPGMLPGFLAALAALAGLVFVCAPLTAGCFRFARNAAARSEPEVFDLAWGYRRAFGRSLALGGVQTVVGVMLAGDSYFFLSLRQPLAGAVGVIFGYAFLFWTLMALFSWPLLAGQPAGAAPEGTLRILKKSALLVLDNFGFTLGLALVVLLLSALLWGTVIGGLVLWPGATAMLLTQAARELLRKYGLLPPDPTLDPIAGETHEFRGHGRHE